MQPIDKESREGKRTVRGRESMLLKEAFAPGRIEVRLGDKTYATDAEETKEDWKKDQFARVAAWNDLVNPDGAKGFEKVAFTGGALVGGITVDRFEVTAKNGEERVYFIHLDTGRLLRVDLNSHAWAYWISIYFDDWRTAGDLSRPHKVTIWNRKAESLIQTYEYTSIRRQS